jgi:formylglycine-generating enzyme required for sulfatase activity
MRFLLATIVVVFLPLSAAAVTIDLVTIGDPNNAPEVNGAGLFGRVTTTYRIGQTEITNAQYVEFLNAKAAADPLNLYSVSMGSNSNGGIIRSGASGSFSYALRPPAADAGPGGASYSYGDKPVNYISFFDALRFANWMNNGQGSGNTETGAYTILGGTATPTNADSITRNAGAIWFLPSENEWYKAAYYNPTTSSYFDYPTATDSAPNNNLPAADTGNSANHLIGVTTTTGDPGYPMTPVGAYALSDSPYGTLDQGGNVAEWNEALVTAGSRGLRGGGWNTTGSTLASASRGSMIAAIENSASGFRLATIAAASPVVGDYNGNGAVDAADYVVWRDHLGTAFQLPNEVGGLTPGNVTPEDYDAWRARFGNISGAGSSAAVPEPGTMMLLSIAVAFEKLRRRRSGFSLTSNS